MMDIDEEDVLRNVAAGAPVDFSLWPALLPRIVSRIEKIAHHEFPIPRLRPPPTATLPPSMPLPTRTDSEVAETFLSPLPSSPTEPSSGVSSQENKENAPSAPRQNPQPPTPSPGVNTLPPGALPPQIVSMLDEITSTLTSLFSRYPPHTLQRLSELVLAPKQHYRTLPTYLHALDRVVHVTSGLNVYPLPPAVPDIKSGSLLSNGVNDPLTTPPPWATPGSDEALGGALLTPIPWLQQSHHGIGRHSHSPLGTPPERRSTSIGPNNVAVGGMVSDLEGEVRTESTETIDGPNGVGSIETVSVSVNGIPSMGARGIGVTQGELLRQEQRAGVVPVTQLVPNHHVHSGNPLIQAHRRAAALPDSGSAAAEEGQRSQSPNLTMERRGSSAAASTGDSTTTAGTEDAGPSPNTGVLASMVGSEDEKPHARGPEEIGPEDMGPQSASTGSGGAGGGNGFEMQGIDLEAAVGRKAVSSANGAEAAANPTLAPSITTTTTTTNTKPEEGAADEAGDDAEMDVDKDGVKQRQSTPKREAEDELEDGASAKKIKEEGREGEEQGGPVDQKRDPDPGAMDTSEDRQPAEQAVEAAAEEAKGAEAQQEVEREGDAACV
ncbi:hypothetical protein GGS23DRAFT_458909 [Durotheca rogersii]|uniref:uncharacterized protein n=1 Tax=Durotheca rogersii TaxID=419775 RepID=UPI002220B556|nr:uncharacterized protein GGS23DRAFT_458909 [Durotheca rogersii]KAI5864671.1 hypothetical protein GGS23DRAFT_458909 [Durotheca rogersii]